MLCFYKKKFILTKEEAELKMKNKFLLTLLALGFTVPAFAYISSSDTYSADFLKRSGYSDLSVQMVAHERAKAANTTLEPQKKIIKNPILRSLYNAYLYFDPSVEDGQFLNHNINMDPSREDL